MNICLFGIYDSKYARNRVLILGFKDRGFNVIECKVDPKKYRGIRKFFRLYREYRKVKNLNLDHIIVAFPVHTVVWFAYLLFGRKIIFDAFVSLYNSEVEDRKTVSALSVRALYYWLLDFISCMLAKTVLLDTNTHIAYFVKRYHIARSKFIRVLVGTTAKDFYPCAQRESAKFIVHFHGHFTPLHGLEYVIEAAHILHEHRDVHFQIIGGGLGERAIKDRVAYLDLHNIEFMNSAPFDVLNKYINKASVCLGIFGDTTKARMVIPNKVFEALACGKPVITQNSDAIAELLVDQESVLLCEGGNAQDLAEKILLLKEKQTLQKKIAANGYHIFMQKLQPHMIVGDIIG